MPARKTQFCPKGHDKDEVGRDVGGGCSQCRRLRGKSPEKRRRDVRKSLGAVNPSGETQAGPCEICGTHAAPLHYDHNHVTGSFRGWLCGPCNRALGLFKDSIETLERAACYLRR